MDLDAGEADWFQNTLCEWVTTPDSGEPAICLLFYRVNLVALLRLSRSSASSSNWSINALNPTPQ